MYAGQKALVDTLVDYASAEARQTAVRLNLVRQGLATRQVVIEDIPYGEQGEPGAGDKTFLALMGGLAFHAPTFIERLKDHEQALAGRVMKGVAKARFDDTYGDYRKAGERMNEVWKQYEEASFHYSDALGWAESDAKKIWLNNMTALDYLWKDYEKASKRYTRERDKWLRKTREAVQGFFNALTVCSQEFCARANMRGYQFRVVRHYGGEMHWKSYCRETDVFDRGVPIIRVTGLPKKSPRTNDMAWGPFLTPPKGYDCDVSSSIINQKAMPTLRRKLWDKQGSPYPPGLTKAEFIGHPRHREEFVAKLQEKGITLPDGWTITQPEVFFDTALKISTDKALATFTSALNEAAGFDLPPLLSQAEFIKSQPIQDIVRTAMGNHYREGIPLNLSEAAFKRQVIDPLIQDRTRHLQGVLKADAEAFANGASLEEEGKQHLRALLVPPIAIFFSLLFGLLNLFGVLTKAVYLIKLPPRRMRQALNVMILAVVIVTPLAIKSPFGDSPAFGRFIDHARQEIGPAALVFDWVIRAQPIIYPVGSLFGALPGVDKILLGDYAD